MITMSVRKYIPIAVTPLTSQRLKEIGNMGDTYETVIKRLLDERETVRQD
jgi:hypothetical protein